MNAITRFIGKHWKRLLVAALGTAVAGGAATKARKRTRMLPMEIPADTGPIVQEPTFAERLRKALPKKRKKSSGGSSGSGSVSSGVPKTATRPSKNTFEEPVKRTPIPQRPLPKSKDVAEEAQRARDNAHETARKLGNDGPDFGLGRNGPR